MAIEPVYPYFLAAKANALDPDYAPGQPVGVVAGPPSGLQLAAAGGVDVTPLPAWGLIQYSPPYDTALTDAVMASVTRGSQGSTALAAAALTTAPLYVVVVSGIVSLPDWTAVTGSAALTPGSVYYLADGLGLLSTTPGSVTQVVGWAASATDLIVRLA